jgi:hypothetical protein
MDCTTAPASSPAAQAASASRPHPTLLRPILRMYSPRPRVPDGTYAIPASSRADRRQLDCRINRADARLKALANRCIVAQTALLARLPLSAPSSSDNRPTMPVPFGKMSYAGLLGLPGGGLRGIVEGGRAFVSNSDR